MYHNVCTQITQISYYSTAILVVVSYAFYIIMVADDGVDRSLMSGVAISVVVIT
jgi:hypothetical protein